jgi:hypothetical protein
MSLPIEMTLVVGIDRKTVYQLAISVETWRAYRPELWTIPWLVFYDRQHPNGIRPGDARRVVTEIIDHRDVRLVHWPSAEAEHENQRERMLSGFVPLPARHVETPWWMKLDTDALALGPSDWLPADWFQPIDQRLPVIVAPPWHYTKPKDQMARLDDWADTVSGLREAPRLDLPVNPDSNKCKHKRICSWCSYYQTNWSMIAAGYAEESCPVDSLPVPSQDGYHWYVATRRGDPILRANQKKRKWTNVSRLRGLEQRAIQAIEEPI